MRPGSVVLVRIPGAAEGATRPKLRPALVLADLPGPYQNLLVCGISARLENLEPDWDELIADSDADFAASGLHRTSAIRPSFLAAVVSEAVAGRIGAVSAARLEKIIARLVGRLSEPAML
jgi:mRNA interferase MazF